MFKIRQITSLTYLEVGRATCALCEKQDDLFKYSRKYSVLEHDQLDAGEALKKKATNRRCIVHCQKFSRQYKSEPTSRLEEL